MTMAHERIRSREMKGGRPLPASADSRLETLALFVDAILAFTILIRLRFHLPVVTVGSLLAITAVLPQTVGTLRAVLRTRFGRVFLGSTIIAEGLILWSGSADVRSVHVLTLPWLVVSAVVIAGLVRRRGLSWTMVLVGAGGVVGGYWAPNVLNSGNDWKYNVGLPAALALIALGVRSWKLATLAAVVVCAISIADDTRSIAILCALALLFSVTTRTRESIEAGSKRGIRRRRWVIGALVAMPFAYVALFGALHGWLGASIQTHSVAQAKGGGPTDLALAARPELLPNLSMAGSSLFESPLGRPLPNDLRTAYLSSYELHGGGIYSDYVQNYVLATFPEFHSILTDLWYYYGLGGLATGVCLVWIAIDLLRARGLQGNAVFLPAFMGLSFLFYLCVGPFSDLRFAPAPVGVCLALMSLDAPKRGGAMRAQSASELDARDRVGTFQ